MQPYNCWLSSTTRGVPLIFYYGSSFQMTSRFQWSLQRSIIFEWLLCTLLVVLLWKSCDVILRLQILTCWDKMYHVFHSRTVHQTLFPYMLFVTPFLPFNLMAHHMLREIHARASKFEAGHQIGALEYLDYLHTHAPSPPLLYVRGVVSLATDLWYKHLGHMHASQLKDLLIQFGALSFSHVSSHGCLLGKKSVLP